VVASRRRDFLSRLAIQSHGGARHDEPDILARVSRRNYDVTPDDQRFLMVHRAGGGGAQLVVVENWFQETKARRPP
jgi:hypothetical protein